MTGGTDSGTPKGSGSCAALRSRFPVVPLPLPPGEEAETPDESAQPAPPATRPRFKHSLPVIGTQRPPAPRPPGRRGAAAERPPPPPRAATSPSFKNSLRVIGMQLLPVLLQQEG